MPTLHKYNAFEAGFSVLRSFSTTHRLGSAQLAHLPFMDHNDPTPEQIGVPMTALSVSALSVEELAAELSVTCSHRGA